MSNKNQSNSAIAQVSRLLNYLLEHGSVSSTYAREVLSCYHLKARILEIRQRGYEIKLTWSVVTDSQGREHRVGVWLLTGLPQVAA
ncbi:MAG: helix-turn-helix domain-containing protein [Agitococcus sp.]|nr:helix-turn-helix domain-containing protein [Agitococcus sp.]